MTWEKHDNVSIGMVSVKLSDTQNAWVRKVAKEYNVGLSDVVRWCIDDAMQAGRGKQ